MDTVTPSSMLQYNQFTVEDMRRFAGEAALGVMKRHGEISLKPARR